MDTGSKVGEHEVPGIERAGDPVAYEPPAVLALGNVHELLAGVGSKQPDAMCLAKGDADIIDPTC
jgi:hypothetical protein